MAEETPAQPRPEGNDTISLSNPGPGSLPDRDPLPVVIVACSLLLYLVSMPKTVALEDDAIFILSGYFNGVSHPPGYPLYTLIVHLFSQIPLGGIAARAHASSAVFAALACGLMFLIGRRVGLDRALATILAATFAVSNTFWSQAIITEVYSLNLCLNLGLFLIAYRIGCDSAPGERQRLREFMLFSLILGLALANHWPLTVLALPAYLLLLARPFARLGNKWLPLIPVVAVSASAYLYLYLNNQSSPFINFSGEFGSLREFIDFVLRSHYEIVDRNDSAGLGDKARFTLDLLVQFARELNLLLPFAGYGIYHLLSQRSERVVGLAVLWLILANSLLLVLLIDFDYGELYSNVFRVYPLVSIALLFVAAACGIARLLAIGRHEAGHRLAVTGLLLSLVASLFFSLPQNYRNGYRWGEVYAHRILADVPEGAVLFADGDVELPLLAYLRHVVNARPDIELYSSSALLLDNRLFDYRLEDKKAFLDRYVQEHPQQAFYVANNYYDLNRESATLFTEKLGSGEDEPPHSIDSDDVDLLLEWSAAPDTRDPWTRLAVEILRHRAISILTPSLKTTTDAGLRNYIGQAIDALIQSDEDRLHFLVTLFDGEREVDPGYLRGQLAAIDATRLASKQMDSHYVYLEALAGQALLTAALRDKAHRKACLNWPSRKNSYCQAGPNG